jgi:erythronate-4-phosphate dehydrogenase
MDGSMKIVADGNIPFVRECFSSIGEVEVVGGREITREVVADAEALLVRSITAVNEGLLSGSKVRFVATATIGFDHIDVEYLRRRNIGFASAPGSNANSAAEYVVAALLEVGQENNVELEGKSIGIIGVGNVGSRVAKKCAALGMEVRLNDPPLQRYKSHSPEGQEEHRGFESALLRVEQFTGKSEFLPIEELFECDFITLHTPLTFEGADKTHHLGDDRFFRSLREGCVFVNASRGGVVDSGALKRGILGGRLGAIVLDVWENEPDIDVELLRMVDIGTPHIAGYSLDGKIAGMIMIYEAACAYFGVGAEHGIEDFLPEAGVPELRVDAAAGSEQEALMGAVRAVYDVRRDDALLREIRECRAGKAGEFFDNLRKEYPVRREFVNMRVVPEGACESLSRKLAGIGFTVGR